MEQAMVAAADFLPWLMAHEIAHHLRISAAGQVLDGDELQAGACPHRGGHLRLTREGSVGATLRKPGQALAALASGQQHAKHSCPHCHRR